MRKGFALFEVLIALVIVAILGAIFSNKSLADKYKSQASELTTIAEKYSKAIESYYCFTSKQSIALSELGIYIPKSSLYFTYELGKTDSSSYIQITGKKPFGKCPKGSKWVLEYTKGKYTTSINSSCEYLTSSFKDYNLITGNTNCLVSSSSIVSSSSTLVISSSSSPDFNRKCLKYKPNEMLNFYGAYCFQCFEFDNTSDIWMYICADSDNFSYNTGGNLPYWNNSGNGYPTKIGNWVKVNRTN